MLKITVKTAIAKNAQSPPVKLKIKLVGVPAKNEERIIFVINTKKAFLRLRYTIEIKITAFEMPGFMPLINRGGSWASMTKTISAAAEKIPIVTMSFIVVLAFVLNPPYNQVAFDVLFFAYILLYLFILDLSKFIFM